MTIKEKLLGRKYDLAITIEGGVVKSIEKKLNGVPYTEGEKFFDDVIQESLSNPLVEKAKARTFGKVGESEKYSVSMTRGGLLPRILS